MKTESEALMDTLMFTLAVIVSEDGENRVRIAKAYAEAQELVASIKISNGDARPRIVACFERFDAYKAADDAAAAGWMLAALQQRIGERNLKDWEKLAVVADKAVEMLPGPEAALGKGLRQV
jgi:ParB-like chromosome segregation protein Spo0J